MSNEFFYFNMDLKRRWSPPLDQHWNHRWRDVFCWVRSSCSEQILQNDYWIGNVVLCTYRFLTICGKMPRIEVHHSLDSEWPNRSQTLNRCDSAVPKPVQRKDDAGSHHMPVVAHSSSWNFVHINACLFS